MLNRLLGAYHGGWGQECRAAGGPQIICKAEIQPSGPSGELRLGWNWRVGSCIEVLLCRLGRDRVQKAKGRGGRGAGPAWVDVEVQRLHGTGVCSLPAGLDRSQGRPDLDEAAAGTGAQRRG